MNGKSLYLEIVKILGPESEHEAMWIFQSALETQTFKNGDAFLRFQDEFFRSEIKSKIAEWAMKVATLRKNGQPLQYLLGYQKFLDHRYRVVPGILIPRPETEGLVEEASKRIKIGLSGSCGNSSLKGVEFGVGSGAVLGELAFRFPNIEWCAVDISPISKAICEENWRSFGIYSTSKIEFILNTDPDAVLEKIIDRGQTFDFILSNPPYLDPNNVREETDADVFGFEPGQALFAPKENLTYFYTKLCLEGSRLVRAGGWVGLEIPHERASLIQSQWKSNPYWFNVELLNDLSGRPRYLFATRTDIL